jgi:hypothetical protein
MISESIASYLAFLIDSIQSGTSQPDSFITLAIERRYTMSSSVKNVTAWPLRPPRPVRPMRWM